MNGGAGRVSPAANCAAVTGEGNQLNPRAGGQAARQTRLNEWETINNSGEEATVNKIMAPKVKVLPATGQSEGGKGGSLRRGIDRNGVLQPGGRNLLLFPPQLREQPGALALTPNPASTAGAWALVLSPPYSSHPADTGTAPQTPAYSHLPKHIARHASAPLPHPEPISQSSLPQLCWLTKHHLCFPSLPSSHHLGPRGQSPRACSANTFPTGSHPPPSLPPAIASGEYQWRGPIEGK